MRLTDWSIDPRLVADWAKTHGVRIVVVLIAAAIIRRVANAAIDTLQHRLGYGQHRDPEWERRASTLGGILVRVVTVAVYFVATMMILRELSIDVVPLLTGAGIAGLAIGFGAQNLVRDVISGFFLILEDQVRVGDIARINSITGNVEEVNLRTIVLRDGEGAVHVFPNGTVTALANLSKQFSVAIVDVRIAYSENLDRVYGTIREVGESMQRDPQWASRILTPIDIAGVESMADNLVTIRVKFKTQPLNQGGVANELRRRLFTTFSGRGIRPYAG